VLGDELAIAGFPQSGRVLTEQFLPAVETFRETMLRRRLLARPFGRGQAGELPFLLLNGRLMMLGGMGREC